MAIRGRKRKPGKRYPCGKRTRQETEKDAMSTVIEARRRHFGVTAKQARDEKLGTALGRLAFQELISEGNIRPALPSGSSITDIMLPWGFPAQSAVGCGAADQRGHLRQ